MRADRPQHPGDPGRSPAVEQLAAQLDRVIQALGRLVLVLEELTARPPVHLQVERLGVQTLAFHLGDIDVEQLEGQLNIGITHSLTLESGPSPGEDEPVRPPGAPRARPFEVDPARPAPFGAGTPGRRAAGESAPDGRAGGKPGPGDDDSGRPPRALRNSVVSRWLAQPGQGAPARSGRPAGDRPEQAGPACETAPAGTHPEAAGPADAGPAAADGSSPPRIQIWPPPDAEGSETDGEGQPGAVR